MQVFTNKLQGTTTDPVLHLDSTPTNYRKDSHERFCARCFKHNGKCLNTGSKHKDSSCRA